MQKIILSVLSDGQIHGHFTAKFIFHGHGFDSIGSTRPHQAHNDPEASKASEEAASGAGEEASKEIRAKLPPALAPDTEASEEEKEAARKRKR
uniref:Uncharacterized protein n=1 Tax=Fagus sylvatica TaxID=28930 RepID=A0A2N9FNR5_FAGSY